MGMLMIKVGETWIPYTPAGTVGPPAEVNARSDAVTDARFGNLGQPDNVGFMAGLNGNQYVIVPSTSNGFQVFDVTSGTAYLDLATFKQRNAVPNLKVGVAEMGSRAGFPTWARFGRSTDTATQQGYIIQEDGNLEMNMPANKETFVYDVGIGRVASFTAPRSTINNFTIGNHPVHNPADWVAGYSKLSNDSLNGAEYTFLVGKPGGGTSGMTLLNGWTNLQLRVGNQRRIEVASGDNNYITGANGSYHEFSNGAVHGHFQTAAVDWPNWGLLSWSAPGYSGFNGIHADGTAAAAWRIYPGQGEAMYAVNYNNTLHTPVGGLRWDTMSSATIKKDIRSLRPEREHVVVRPLTPGADTVEQPDIMSLRPTVFRHKGKAGRPVPDADGEYRDAAEDYPDDNWIQRVRTREVLGLIAEEVQYVVPSAVIHNEGGDPIALDYNQIIVALLDHVQELTRTVETLRYRITELENA